MEISNLIHGKFVFYSEGKMELRAFMSHAAAKERLKLIKILIFV